MGNQLRTSAVIFLCALATAGCAVGRRYSYHLANPRMTSRGSLSVALAVQDQREALTTGGRSPDFVGFQRGGFGKAFDIVTASGQPLADDFATSIGRALEQAGYRVKRVRVSNLASPAHVQGPMARSGAERGLVVQIEEWKSDTYSNTALHYDVTMRVLGPGGEELGRATIKGDDTLGGDIGERTVPPAYSRILERLLNDPAIARALAPAAAPPGAAPPVTSAPAS
jgi:hypothetical protein